MAEKTFDDTDPSVYSSHILYITKHDSNCNEVVARLVGLELGEAAFVQDVMALAQRPSWLRGVPSLYVKDTSKVLTGSRDILAYASSWENPDHTGMSSSLTSFGTFGSGGVGGSSLFDDSMFTLDGEPTTTRASGGESKPTGERASRRAALAEATSSAVEDLQNSRSEMDRRFHTTNQPGRTPAPRNVLESTRDVPVPQQRRGFDDW